MILKINKDFLNIYLVICGHTHCTDLIIIILLQRSLWTFHIWSPVRAMSRTVRRRSVAFPWSLFPMELSVGRVVSLSSLWFVLSVRRGKWLTLLCQSFSCGYVVCIGLFLAGISMSVRGTIVGEGNLVGGS